MCISKDKHTCYSFNIHVLVYIYRTFSHILLTIGSEIAYAIHAILVVLVVFQTLNLFKLILTTSNPLG